jgi:hypothetical protein
LGSSKTWLKNKNPQAPACAGSRHVLNAICKVLWGQRTLVITPMKYFDAAIQNGANL